MDKTWIGKTTYENNLTKKVKIAKKQQPNCRIEQKTIEAMTFCPNCVCSVHFEFGV